MKNLHPARKRLLAGVLLLAVTFFYAFAASCGKIGWLVARASGYLLGQTGSTLLALTSLVVGVLLVVPHGAIGAFFRWTWHGREARVNRVVRDMDDFERTRRRDEALARRGLTADDVKRLVAEALASTKVTTQLAVAAPTTPAVPPVERMRLDDVRGAMKQLGYTKAEYEPVVAGLDPKVPLEVLVRNAIKTLHAKAN